VLVTCRMTYLYHGAADVIGRVKRRWPNTPVALGGTYASLCPDHARKHTQADEIFDNRNPLTASEWLSRHLSSGPVPTLPENLSNWPRPAVDLCHSRQTLPLLTSLGCPFRCSYCASSRLAPSYQRRTAEDLFEEFFEHALRSQTTDFAFYDDALLVDADRYIQPFFELVIAENLPCRFHTPNGLHYTLITPGLAHTMRQAGVTTIRLSLETVSPKNLAAWNRSGDKDVFRRSVTSLLEAGYAREEIGAYVLAGMPGQTVDEVRRSIDLAHEAGATPKVNEYSPIPGTTEWPRSLALSGPEIEAEPLWQNNSLYHTRGEIFDVPTLQTLKALSHQTP
ncbi:radical SAM protein, partial [bacterium]|nr:radical SAM protein [bacterium]